MTRKMGKSANRQMSDVTLLPRLLPICAMSPFAASVVPRHQGDPQVQRPPQRVERRRPDPRLMQLPVSRLDSEPVRICLVRAVKRRLPQGLGGVPAPHLRCRKPLMECRQLVQIDTQFARLQAQGARPCS
jgi:hypothetical protein